ncbi:alkaline phosphatase, partial [Dehalococcoidia bacterium]|nr:alkaline phosphatase [Dehalococcoidia bacterium]
MHKRLIGMVAVLLAVALVATGCPRPVAEVEEPRTRNVIFFHPDGYGPNHWNALRIWLVGPDDRLNWDRLPYMA